LSTRQFRAGEDALPADPALPARPLGTRGSERPLALALCCRATKPAALNALPPLPCFGLRGSFRTLSSSALGIGPPSDMALLGSSRQFGMTREMTRPWRFGLLGLPSIGSSSQVLVTSAPRAPTCGFRGRLK